MIHWLLWSKLVPKTTTPPSSPSDFAGPPLQRAGAADPSGSASADLAVWQGLAAAARAAAAAPGVRAGRRLPRHSQARPRLLQPPRRLGRKGVGVGPKHTPHVGTHHTESRHPFIASQALSAAVRTAAVDRGHVTAGVVSDYCPVFARNGQGVHARLKFFLLI